jgi:hypothetical protein
MSFKENIIPSIFILIIIVILVLVTKYAPWLICTRNPFSGNCLDSSLNSDEYERRKTT